MTISTPKSPQRTFRLGLIGGNITETRSPVLHATCGLSLGANVTYDLIIPAERGHSFADLLVQCETAGFDGVNVTYPFKEEAAALIPAGNPVVAAMGSANTIRFTPEGPRAFNTDHSGFIAAYRKLYGEAAPGRVLVLGTGGVGRAVAFGLADLGASEIVLYDMDAAKVASLKAALESHSGITVSTCSAHELSDLSGFDGVVNCTPLGMVGRPGSPLPADVSGPVHWGFDAVYTPEFTQFRAQIEQLGGTFLSGYELYFHQGVDAFEIFTGLEVSETDWVRGIITHKPAA
ncbi:shikimate dehydrogenase [Sinirhodobacter sp. WL0062]|uniref:Shikimate dehydrogenase n=1 Tax=Rhodobacter flavimaris TaxID=2907145 RepID=A0ABS8YTA3_9RHOB|nr:shikimate dehydrogenase [Sinirhodobacter sp. WL0062]MCE5973089.1 shikimate dehydrogenase [Sinirhodobacter sp. WL0062]